MSFTATPTDGSSPTPIPMSSVVPDGTNTPLAVEGGPSITTGGNTLAPVSMYIKDGNNVTQGNTTDAAVVGDNPGTLSGKLRGLTKILNDVWDSVNHRLHVTVDNTVALGQATMVGSSPVVLASDQSAIKIKPDYLEVAGAGPGVVNAINTDLFAWIDVSGYKWFTVQTTGTWSGTLTVQASGDGVTPIATWGYNANSGTLLQIISGNNLFIAPVTAKWLRVRMTAFTSNTSLVGTLGLFTTPPPPLAVLASQNGTWTMQPGNTQNTTPWLMAGPNANGVQAANSAANTVIKGSSGWLYHAIITTLGTAALTVYDNASTNTGTPLLVIPASAAVGTIYSFPSGARAVNGIVSAGVLNCPAVTFHYT